MQKGRAPLPLPRRPSGPTREDRGPASIRDSRQRGAGRAGALPGGEGSLGPQVGSGQVRELAGHHALGVVVLPREACGRWKGRVIPWRVSQSRRQCHESPRPWPRAAPPVLRGAGPPPPPWSRNGPALRSVETQARWPWARAARGRPHACVSRKEVLSHGHGSRQGEDAPHPCVHRPRPTPPPHPARRPPASVMTKSLSRNAGEAVTKATSCDCALMTRAADHMIIMLGITQ